MNIQLTYEKRSKKMPLNLGLIFFIKYIKKCLLTIFDSPLNKTGNARVFIKTMDNVLI